MKIKRSLTVKLLSGIVSLLILFSLAVSYIGYHEFTSALLHQYSEDAFHTADSAAAAIIPDHLERFLKSGGKTSEYEAAWYKLDQLCNTQDVTFIYVIQPDLTDYAHITFIFSTINHDSPYTVYDFGYVRETTNEEYRQKYKALYDRELDRAVVIRDKGYIETDPHITAMIPLKGANGSVRGILCVQRQMDKLVTARRAYIHKVALLLLLALLVVIAGQGWYLFRILLHPLQKITGEARRFAAENNASASPLASIIRNQDEIGMLAQSIDQMETQILEYEENLTRITAEKERTSAELDLARNIQAGVLPSVFPPFPNREEFEIYASMTPARQVGGDFYDFFLLNEDHLGLVIADVSGKGVPAALFMMISRILLSNALQSGLSPAEALISVNEQLCRSNKAEMFVTVWLGVLELSTGRLKAANAGHEYPAIGRAGRGFGLFHDSHGFVLGGMPGMKYKEYELQLAHGDAIFVYTDGVPEATDADGSLMGTDRMLEALNQTGLPAAQAAPGSAEALIRNVYRGIHEFVQDTPPFDDITMLCCIYR